MFCKCSVCVRVCNVNVYKNNSYNAFAHTFTNLYRQTGA